MINYNNHNITGISYNNHSIKYVYGCGGNLVWSGDTPTPPTSMKWIGTTTLVANADPNSGVCNSSSVLTLLEINDNIPYTGWTWNLVQDFEIGDCVTELGENLCNSCTNLTAVTIPNTITSIGASAFYGCTSLTSITIPDSVTTIGDSSFRSSINLLDITIPSGVTYIGKAAFGSIGTNSPYVPLIFTCLATTPPTLETYDSSYLPFYRSSVEIYVPDAVVNDYKTANGWSTYTDKIKPISEKP